MALAADLVFLVLFPVVAIWLVAVVDDRVRWWPPPAEDWIDPAAFNGEQIGQLNEGDVRAVEAAVARLRLSGALEYDDASGALVATGQQPDDEGTPLAAAVLAAVAKGTAIDELVTDPDAKAALDDQRAGLDRLLRSQGIATPWDAPDVPKEFMIRAAVPLMVLAAVGAVWVFLWSFRWYTDIPVALMVLFLVLVLTGVATTRPSDMRTVGERAVLRVMTANEHLRPSMRPALTTYGPAAAALAVGLYGLQVLTPTDPALAAAATDDSSPDRGAGGGADFEFVDPGSASDSSSCGGSSCGGGCGGGCGG